MSKLALHSTVLLLCGVLLTLPCLAAMQECCCTRTKAVEDANTVQEDVPSCCSQKAQPSTMDTTCTATTADDASALQYCGCKDALTAAHMPVPVAVPEKSHHDIPGHTSLVALLIANTDSLHLAVEHSPPLRLPTSPVLLYTTLQL